MFTKTQIVSAIAGLAVGFVGAVGEVVTAKGAIAAPTTIDFNNYKYRDIVKEIMTLDQTITFSLLDPNAVNDGLFAYPLSRPVYPGASGIMVMPVSTATAQPYGLFSDFAIDFANPIDFFSFLALDSDEPVSARGYYQGQLINTVSAIPNTWTPGIDRQVSELRFGAVGGGQFYDRIEIDVVEGTPGKLDGGPETFDTLTYNVSSLPIKARSVAVPEPGMILGLLGLAGLGGKTLRRRFE